MIGAVKYYNENCAGLNTAGYRKMNQGLKRFKMHRTPVPMLLLIIKIEIFFSLFKCF
jgi:hypothetical protein